MRRRCCARCHSAQVRAELPTALFEAGDKLIVLDKNLAVRREVATGQICYGVSFDPSGKRLYVAAAECERIDVFDAMSFAPLAYIRSASAGRPQPCAGSPRAESFAR